jgi:hypothetical protein
MGEKGGDMGKYRVREMRDGRGVTYFLPQRKGWLFWRTITYFSGWAMMERSYIMQLEAKEACFEDAKLRGRGVVVKDYDVLV